MTDITAERVADAWDSLTTAIAERSASWSSGTENVRSRSGRQRQLRLVRGIDAYLGFFPATSTGCPAAPCTASARPCW